MTTDELLEAFPVTEITPEGGEVNLANDPVLLEYEPIKALSKISHESSFDAAQVYRACFTSF